MTENHLPFEKGTAGIKQFFRVAVTPEDYLNIHTAVWKDNRDAVRIYALISSIYMLVLTLLAIFLDSFAPFFPLYLTGTLVMLGIYCVSFLLQGKYVNLSGWLIIVFRLALDAFAIILSIVFSPDNMTVTFVAVLLIGNTPFTDRKHRLVILNLLSMVVFSILAFRVKPTPIYISDLTDVWVFGTVGILSGIYTTKIRLQYYLSEYRVQQVSETDGLTGLKNRYCYESRMKSYPSACQKSLSCIYVDVNGLHTLNNEKGHAAGDEMLKAMAECLAETFGRENSYRIGGDEFIAFASDVPEEVLCRKIEGLRETMDQKHYHLSIGCAFENDPKEETMDDLIQRAEQKMYEQKTQYYSSSGNDRRRR